MKPELFYDEISLLYAISGREPKEIYDYFATPKEYQRLSESISEENRLMFNEIETYGYGYNKLTLRGFYTASWGDGSCEDLHFDIVIDVYTGTIDDVILNDAISTRYLFGKDRDKFMVSSDKVILPKAIDFGDSMGLELFQSKYGDYRATEDVPMLGVIYPDAKINYIYWRHMVVSTFNDRIYYGLADGVLGGEVVTYAYLKSEKNDTQNFVVLIKKDKDGQVEITHTPMRVGEFTGSIGKFMYALDLYQDFLQYIEKRREDIHNKTMEEVSNESI